MRSSAFSTEATGGGRHATSPGLRVRRGLARLLAATIVFVTPGGAYAGSELPQADAATTSNGHIDNTLDGQTTITSFDHLGETVWHDGLNQPEDHILFYDLPEVDSTHINIVGGDFAAHLNGQVRSVDPNAEHTLVFASPHGVFVGANAVIDIGKLVAIGADLSRIDDMDQPILPLTGPVVIEGTVKASQGALLYGTHVLNMGEIYTPAGQLFMLGGEALHLLGADTIVEGLINPIDFTADLGSGVVWNDGLIEAADATLIGRRVINQGHIRIDDGTLLMAAGDQVHLRRFEDPVVVSLPQSRPGAIRRNEDHAYAIDQQGTIDAGRGHVRLSAADALGWGIRQGRSTPDASTSIVAQRIDIDAGEGGRVELAGIVDASGSGEQDGGEITVTGETIVLIDAAIDASSANADGGSIRIGGDLQGTGDLQRAQAVVMDADSAIRADGGEVGGVGDGGRVILFSEHLTHLSGAISARAGDLGGDGGFIETSGLAYFHIDDTPDARAPAGENGEWLIDPFTIDIVLDTVAPSCAAETDACLNQALEQILLPDFDDAGFDNVLRTIDPAGMGLNQVSVDLIVRALSVGTDVTLSTEAFNPAAGDSDEYLTGTGDINVQTAIQIPDGAAARGTRARLTLRAAGDIHVQPGAVIEAGPGGATGDMVLDVQLQANDQSQRDSAASFDRGQLLGSVLIEADIRTGGGDLIASGINVTQTAASTVETGGGLVSYVSGSRDRNNVSAIYERDDDGEDLLTPTGLPAVATPTPGVTLQGNIDSSRYSDDPGQGGDVVFSANSVGVRTAKSGNDELTIFTGELLVDSGVEIRTGGGSVSLLAGVRGSTDVGNVTVDAGALIDTSREILDDAGTTVLRREGGDVVLDANRLYADADITSVDVVFDPASPLSEGGNISIGAGSTIRTRGGDISIGSTHAGSISINGTLNTTHTELAALNLPGAASNDDPDDIDVTALDNGSIAIAAIDQADTDRRDDETRYGQGEISLGGTGGATLLSSAITLQSRTITIDAGANTAADTVTMRVAGDADSTITKTSVGLTPEVGDSTLFSTVGTVRFEADEEMSFGGNTSVTADRIEVVAAARPSELNPVPVPPAPDVTVRVEFAGDNTATGGTTFAANDISIEIGDGTTTSSDLDFVDPADDPDFAREREAVGSYAGLILRDETGSLRPENVSILQDGDLTVAGSAGTDLYFGGQSGSGSTDGIFGNAAIGTEGQTIVLESRDGTLSVAAAAAAGLNDDLTPGTDETDGRSFVTLHGGFELPTALSGPVDPSIDISSSAGFDLTALTITTPRDLTITAPGSGGFELESAITSVDELVVQAGRPVQLPLLDVDGETIGGTLTVEGGVTLTATDSLELHGAARGFGDLVFDTSSTTSLESNGISLRAGGGALNEETDPADYAAISGANEVAFRRADGGAFENGTAAESFSFRQDAGIDGDVVLPTLDDFGVAGANFGGTADAIEYALRSDFGGIDLRGVGVNQILNTHLSLIGFGTTEVDETFVWDGPSVELGGTRDFLFTTELADAFTPSDATSTTTERVRLRAGLNGPGTLTVQGGATVRAPIVELVAGDGRGGETESPINVSGAVFDLTDAGTAGFLDVDRTFIFHEDENVSLADLPSASQFAGDLAGLPQIIGLRNDAGAITLTNPDLRTLPFDLSNDARLIIEAPVVQLVATGTLDLELTGDEAGSTDLNNIHLRLRGEQIDIAAAGGNDTARGEIYLGERGTIPTGTLRGGDATFDDANLLIEGFDADSEFVATTNLSDRSRATDPMDANNEDYFDLSQGRGPSTLTIAQDESISASELPLRWHVAGEFGASNVEDNLGNPIPTILRLDSNFGDVEIRSDNVSGARIEIGTEDDPIAGSLRIDEGTGAYVFDDLIAFAREEIRVGPGADLTATGRDGEIRLEAGVLLEDPTEEIDESNPLFDLVFESTGTAQTDLRANVITLQAGPLFELRNADSDDDGLPDEIALDVDGESAVDRENRRRAILGDLDLDGLASIDITDPNASATLTVAQSNDFDTLTLFNALVGSAEWDTIDLASIEGTLAVEDLAGVAAATRALRLGVASDQVDNIVTIERTDTTSDIFSVTSGFQGGVTIEANDIRFDATNDAAPLRLDSPNLRVVGDIFGNFLETDAERGRVNGDPNVLDRQKITVLHQGDFVGTRLIRPDRYRQLGFDFLTSTLEETPRESLARVAIRLVTENDTFRFEDDLRDDVRESNLTIETTSAAADRELVIDIDSLAPGVRDYAFGSVPDADSTDFAAISLTSFEAVNFERATIAPYAPTLPEGGSDPRNLTFETTGDQAWTRPTDPSPGSVDPTDPSLDIRLQSGLQLSGRDILLGGNVYTDSTTDHFDLFVLSGGDVRFEGDIGVNPDAPTDADARLGSLWVFFDDEGTDATPVAQFGRRLDLDADEDEIQETPGGTDQQVLVEDHIVFVAAPLNEPDIPQDANDSNVIDDLQSAIADADTLSDPGVGETALEDALESFAAGRKTPAQTATIGKALGSLAFDSANGGNIVMGSGERLAVGGDLTITNTGGLVTLGDVAVGDNTPPPGPAPNYTPATGVVTIDAAEIGLVRRNSGVTRVLDGATTADGGSIIMANVFDFGGVTPEVIGTGKEVLFGVPNPYAASLPSFLDQFSVSANRSRGAAIVAADFTFTGGSSLDQVAFPLPTGASRSELTGAFGPFEEPVLVPTPRELALLADRERLIRLGVEAQPASPAIARARLRGAAIIDDVASADARGDGAVRVTDARLDAVDAEAAVELYESLFGLEGERADDVRGVLQEALDRYLETTRARRVIGFELRRFVKNRPSTLLEAYSTLDRLDALFRYHRRLGLSPGEYRQVQADWLAAIQPEGITLDELSEAIHPSRYVRGSDILDIFGR